MSATGDIADDELLSPTSVESYLIARGVVRRGTPVRARELGGGVSNIVLAVDAGTERFVVKQALPRLRVATEWLAHRSRAVTEARALGLAATITPDAVPRVIDVDEARCALVITAAPAGWRNWKDDLLGGRVDTPVAAELGTTVAAWHTATADRQVLTTFDKPDAFAQLRLDPYHRSTVARHPDLEHQVAPLIEELASARMCLVHGDLSPKNVLVGDGALWVLDFEVAHSGHPVFDVAFLLHHLILKAAHRPALADAYRAAADAFWTAYATKGHPGAREVRFAHVGILMLARVDGRSPVEYLDEGRRHAVRALARSFILTPPESMSEAWRRARLAWR